MMTQKELEELVKPCEELCYYCGAKCCYNKKTGKKCEALVNNKCTSRNMFCLFVYCNKIEKEFPEIVDKIKAELRERFPEAVIFGVQPNFKWEDM